MEARKTLIGGIPAIIWGRDAQKVYLYVHGKMAYKECAETFALVAEEKGCQTVSFDLPGHGERKAQNERCDIWNGMRDLKIVGDDVFSKWRQVSLFACSLGAFFSLNTYQNREFEKCLFQSPIVDMEGLIQNMMRWSNVTEERLKKEREIDTPVDLLSWDYYTYVREHPITSWRAPTQILYAAKDNLQTREQIDAFAHHFHCGLTVSETSEHPFMAEADFPIVQRWLKANV